MKRVIFLCTSLAVGALLALGLQLTMDGATVVAMNSDEVRATEYLVEVNRAATALETGRGLSLVSPSVYSAKASDIRVAALLGDARDFADRSNRSVMTRGSLEESAVSLRLAASSVHGALAVAQGRKAGAFGAMARRLFLLFSLSFLMLAIPVVRNAVSRLGRHSAERRSEAPAESKAPREVEDPAHATIHAMPGSSVRRAA